MIHRFFRWLRLLLGRCPLCNSDAPYCYECPVCEDYRYGHPPKETKDLWRERMKEIDNG